MSENLPKDLLAAEQAVVTTKDAIRNLEAKPWGPLPPKLAWQRNIRAEHARLLGVLEAQKAKVAALKAGGTVTATATIEWDVEG